MSDDILIEARLDLRSGADGAALLRAGFYIGLGFVAGVAAGVGLIVAMVKLWAALG